ncbi:septal ring lytic transglycosylase RlpA family protein [Nonomuraea sp. CA-218870]|uniref:septal ring lytic transglycosylase RlpA family protein n=1 Tax=Nonomuraea sp. CA-218870 TaxID=3239998 RepID=UPI003D91E759
MGQHSAPNRSKPGKRRWAAVAAGGVAVAVAVTTWAALQGDADGGTTPLVAAVPPRPPVSPEQAEPRAESPTTPTPKATATPAAQAPVAESAPKKKAAPKVRVVASGRCGASYYHEPQMTASGERFNPSAMTAAHKTLKLGSKVRVTNPVTGKSVTVRINDRGPYIGGRCLDLSRAAFAKIGNLNAGVMKVAYEVLAT